jgi:hypothetical protein
LSWLFVLVFVFYGVRFVFVPSLWPLFARLLACLVCCGVCVQLVAVERGALDSHAKAAAHTWVLFSHLRDIRPSYFDLYLLPFNLLTLPIHGIACFSFLVLRALWLYYGALSMSEEAV